MWWTTVALAGAPTFEGSEADVALAEALWTAAYACTGWEPATEEVVPIRRGGAFPPAFDFAGGLSRIGAKGLREILLVEDASGAIFAHEIGHAWFNEEPLAFSEGRAELLSACIAERLPDRVRFERADDYIADHLPDLKAWEDYTEISQRQLHAAYTGAWRLFAIVGAIVPRDRIFARGLRTWEDLDALLASSGSGGRLVIDALAGGAESQRRAFDDPDRDGIENLLERIGGSDPDRWDTDGDGWWDGAPDAPRGAIPLARDGTTACLPRVSSSGMTRVDFGGSLRGTDLEEMSTLAEGNTRIQMGRDQFARRGGYYAQVVGSDLVPNPRCTWTVDATVLVQGDKGFDDLPRFSDAVARAQQRFEERFGPTSHRLVVSVDPEDDRIHNTKVFERAITEVTVAAKLLERALQSGDEALAELAHHAVALHQLADSALPAEPALASALREHVLGRKGPTYGDAYRGDVKRWHRRAKACGGWNALIEDDCPL